MTVAGARFFASDWELSSFHEFFVDLALRAQRDLMDEVQRERLRSHAQLALQTLVVRITENFIAFLDEIEALIRRSQLGQDSVARLFVLSATLPPTDEDMLERRPAELRTELWRHGNSWRLSDDFSERTEVRLFRSSDEAERLARLVTIRNVIQHNRAIVTPSLAAVLHGAAGREGELQLQYRSVKDDLGVLRMVVARTDLDVAARWKLLTPVDRQSFYDAIQSAIKSSVVDSSDPGSPHLDSAAG
jgi:hypothetical protein